MLIDYTEDAVNKIVIAAKTCISTDPVSSAKNVENPYNFLSFLLDAKHLTPFEFVRMTFLISGISRVCSHQLVRHRLTSPLQRSQRYTNHAKLENEVTVLPKSLTQDVRLNAPELFTRIESYLEEASLLYEALVTYGINKEDARYLLPHGMETSMIISMNLREFMHIMALRLAPSAQAEIRNLVLSMVNAVKIKMPVIGAICDQYHLSVGSVNHD